MNILDMANSFEKHICDKADLLKIPIGATLELLPLCNMNCKMCYVRMSYEDVISQGGLLTKENWFTLLDSAKDAGTLFLLLSGGEPLFHPDFKEIYSKAKSMGFVVSVNTNGTLMNKEWADFFVLDCPRRLNISIYGASNKTYELLCDNPKGFDQFDTGIQLLKERNIPIKLSCSLTPQNYDDLEKMILYAQKNDLPIEVASYMFPFHRKDNSVLKSENRLTLEQETNARILYEKMIYGEQFTDKAYASVYCNTFDVELPSKAPNSGFTCRSGSSTYWINWKGEMIPCGMMNHPKVNTLDKSIQESFQVMKEEISKIKRADTCYLCKKEYICQICTAATLAETGKLDGVSEHHCKACDLYLEKLQQYLDEHQIKVKEEN